MIKPKVAFVCVHNSCRSQIAEALAKEKYSDVFESYSAGTHTKDQINQDAVRMMKEQYNIDLEKEQYPKLLDTLPEIDILITMGCNVVCPYLPCKHQEDWNLEDPSGKSDQEMLQTIAEIEKKLENLSRNIDTLLE